MRFTAIYFAFLFLLFPWQPDAPASASELMIGPGVGLNAFASLVDAEFAHTRNALEMAAASENASSGNLDRLKGMLAILAGRDPNIAALWFAQPDGVYFTVDAGLAKQTMRDRAYFPDLMAGKDVVGFLVLSRSTGKKAAIVAVPVRAGAKVIGAVGATIALENLAAEIERKLAFPEGSVFYALDQKGQTALHRETKRIFEFPGKLGSATLTGAVNEMLAAPQGEIHYEFQGAQRTAIFRKSEVTGWIYALRW
jgi:hypothetical protein